MAQFYTDFSEYTPDSDITNEDWSIIDGSGTYTIREQSGDYYVEGENVDDNPGSTLIWDGKNGADIEIVAQLRYSGSGDILIGPVTRWSSGFDGYGGQVEVNTALNYEEEGIYRISGSTRFTEANQFEANIPASFWIRFRTNGDSLQYKKWEDGSSEPSSWTLSVTDSVLSSGETGIHAIDISSYELAEFGVGTDGDTAPTEPVDTGQTFSQSLDESIYPVQNFEETPMKTLRQELSETIKTGRKQ